jgi:DNA-binding winged helix-turn-helix (wHTH) protein
VELLDSVWNLEPAQTTNIVDVYINYLRRKLKDPPPGHFICTVRGRGYMVPSESELALDAAATLALAPADANPVDPVVDPGLAPPVGPSSGPPSDRGPAPTPGALDLR